MPAAGAAAIQIDGVRTVAPTNLDDSDVTEAVVQAKLVVHLIEQGWTVVRTADTSTKEQGITRTGRTLAVEVKGFPGRRYAGPRRAEEVKPTTPTTQARH
jgi:hypothetical protein